MTYTDTARHQNARSINRSNGRDIIPGVRFVQSNPKNQSDLENSIDRDQLFMEFCPLIQKLIGQYGADPELRQDLVGEIYFRFCALIDAYDPNRGVPLKAYLVRQLSASVFTYVRHHWRQQRREAAYDALPNDLSPGEITDPTPSWDHSLVLEQIGEQLPKAVSQLTQRQSQVLIWRYYEERSFEDIAAQLGIQAATVRSLLRHALNNLRRWFDASRFGYEVERSSM